MLFFKLQNHLIIFLPGFRLLGYIIYLHHDHVFSVCVREWWWNLLEATYGGKIMGLDPLTYPASQLLQGGHLHYSPIIKHLLGICVPHHWQSWGVTSSLSSVGLTYNCSTTRWVLQWRPKQWMFREPGARATHSAGGVDTIGTELCICICIYCVLNSYSFQAQSLKFQPPFKVETIFSLTV